ncbi:MAG: FecR domain-containing protein [Candidatus Rokubacteria bacterium]|nr:FecR domain-containing protein [Candidatus Rokubacteria bacterium]
MRLTTSAVVLALAVTGAIAGDVAAQAQHAGVVTTATGTVTVARDAASPTPLRFRDDIYLHDRIATAERSLARILLGGKAVVTVSERSVVTITEAPGRSTIDLISGRISLAVARERMKAGDTVEIRTPIAIAGVRGTVVIAELLAGGAAQFTVVKGLVEVAGLDPGTRLTLPGSTFLAARQTLVATPRGLGAPQTITPEAVQRLGSAFKPAPRPMPAAPAALVTESQVQQAVDAGRRFGSDKRGSKDDDPRGHGRGAAPAGGDTTTSAISAGPDGGRGSSDSHGPGSSGPSSPVSVGPLSSGQPGPISSGSGPSGPISSGPVSAGPPISVTPGPPPTPKHEPKIDHQGPKHAKPDKK